MKKALTQEERTNQILTEPVDRLIVGLAGPAVLSMLITAIYNMADTFFVSQIGTSASAAVGVTFSLMAIVQAFAFMIGQGAGNNISRLLGAGEKTKAEEFAAVGFFTELIVGVLLSVFCLLTQDKMVYWLGATDTIAPYARDYMQWIALGFPFIMGSFGMNNILRFQGHAAKGAAGMMTGGILNMLLDPLFIFGFGLGTKGAAIATAISQMVSFTIMLVQSNRGAGALKIRFCRFRPTAKMYLSIVHVGLPSLARQGIVSLSTIIFNHAAAPYGDACIAAFSIVNRITGFISSAIIGVGQGFQPVCGTNYGAGRYSRVMEAYRFLRKITLIILLVCAVAAFAFATPLIRIFRKEDEEVVRIGTTFLRYQAVTLPLFSLICSNNMCSQTCGYGLRATLLSCLKNGLCLIPLLLILDSVLGLQGLQLAQPLADVFSAIISVLVMRPILRELKKPDAGTRAE